MNFADKLVGALDSAFQTVFGSISDVFDSANSLASRFIDSVAKKFGNPFKSILKFAANALVKAVSIVKSAIDFIGDVIDSVIGGISKAIDMMSDLFTNFLSNSQGDDWGKTVSGDVQDFLDAGNVVDINGENPINRVHPTYSENYKVYKAEFTRILMLLFTATSIGLSGMIDASKEQITSSDGSKTLDFDGYLLKLNDISSMLGLEGDQEYKVWNMLFPTAQNFNQFNGTEVAFDQDPYGTTFATGRHWSMLVDDTGSEKIYYVPIFDSIMDSGTEIIPIRISEFKVMQVVSFISKFLPVTQLMNLLIEVFTKPFVVDLVKTVLPLVTKLFVTRDPAVLKEIMRAIIEPLLMEPLMGHLDKYKTMAQNFAETLLSNISFNDYQSFVSLIRTALFPVMPYGETKTTQSLLNLQTSLFDNQVLKQLDAINGIFKPITEVYDTLGPIIKIAEVIVGGLVNIISEVISGIMHSMQVQLIDNFIFPAIQELYDTTKSVMESFDGEIIKSIINIDRFVSLNQNIIDQVKTSENPITLIIESKIELGITNDDIISFIDGIASILESCISKLLNDPTWLSMILLPLLIPSYEIGKLFGIRSILELLENPSESSLEVNTASSIAIAQEENTEPNYYTSVFVSSIFDFVFNFFNFYTQYLEFTDDENYYNTDKREDPMTERYGGDSMKLLSVTRNDLQGEGASFFINLIEVGLGYLEYQILSSHASNLELSQTDLGLKFISRVANLIKTFVQLIQTVLLHLTTPFTFKDNEFISTIDTIMDASFSITDTSELENRDKLLDFGIKTMAKIGGLIASVFVRTVGSLRNLSPDWLFVAITGLNTFLSDWHFQVLLYEYFISLDSLGINSDVFKDESYNFTYFLNNIIGIPLLNIAMPNATEIELAQLPITISLYLTLLYLNQPVNFIETILQLVFHSEILSQLGDVSNNNSWIGSKILNYISFLVTTFTVITEIFWQFMISMQSSLFYFYCKNNNDNYSLLSTNDTTYTDNDDPMDVKAWDKLFSRVGKFLVGINLGVVKFFKLIRSFKLFIDPAWNSDRDYYGIGIVDLNTNERLEVEEVSDLDHWKQDGAIDIVEAMLSSFKWSMVTGSIFVTLFDVLGTL